MTLAELSIQDFLSELGSDRPVPGGGGVAALSGANAAGLVAMTARLSLHHPETLAKLPGLNDIIAKADRIRAELWSAIDSDAQAFGGLMAAYKLPKNDPAQKQSRVEAIQTGLIAATESPLNIARNCLLVVTMARRMAEAGDTHIVSDAGAAALVSEAALRSALLQARINLKSLNDSEYVAAANLEIATLEKAAQEQREVAYAFTLAKLTPTTKA